MKKLLTLLTVLFCTISSLETKAQSFNFIMTPASQCYNGGSNYMIASVSATAPAATSYSWVVTAPSCSAVISPTSNGMSAYISMPCCGVYTIVCYAYYGSTPITNTAHTATVFCAGSLSLTTQSYNTGSCSPTSYTLFAGGATSYTWSGGSVNGYTGSAIVVSPSVTTCYTVSGSNGGGCSLFTSTCIAAQQGGAQITVSGPSVICAGYSSTLTAGGASTYTWFPGNIVSNSIVVSPTVTSCYSVYGTTGTGCVGTTTSCILVNARPTISSFNTSPGYMCAGNNYTFSAAGAVTYTWQPFNVTGSYIVASPLSSGCYTVTGTNNAGCTNSAIGCYSVMPSPVLSLSGNTNLCAGQSRTLSASGASSYTWLPMGSTGANVVVTPSANICYTVMGSNGFCRTDSTICMTVQPSFLTVSGNSFICAGSSTSLTVSGANTYTWFPGNLIGNSIVVSPTVNTCYSVYGTNSNGCTGTANYCVIVNAKPTINISGSNVICAGQNTTLYAQGASTYTWLPFNQVGFSVVVTPSTSMCYTVLGTNSFGCSNSAINCFSVLPGPVITINGNGSFCSGSTSTLSASGAGSYTWLPTGSTGSSILVTPNFSTGTCYTVIGSNGACSASAVKCITVNPSPVISISGNNAICAGTSANYLANGATTYTWNTGSNSQVITITPSVSSCYTVMGTNGSGCTGMAVKCLSVIPVPIISVSGNDSLCAGNPAVLVASGASSYLWSTGVTSSSVSISPTTNTFITVVGSNGTCSRTKLVNIFVMPSPNIVAVSSASYLCSGSTVTLIASGALTYTWSNGANTAATVVAPLVSTVYTVTGFGANGCYGQSTVMQNVSICSGLGQNSGNLVDFNLFPNPSHGNLTLQNSTTKLTSYRVFDLSGRILMEGEFTLSKNIDLTDLANGTYVLKFISGAEVSFKKLIVEH